MADKIDKQLNPQVIQPQSAGQPMSDQQDSPYFDQQVLPGQVIGYGLPTDQHVFSQSVSAPKKNTKKPLVIGLLLFAAITGITAGAFLFIF